MLSSFSFFLNFVVVVVVVQETSLHGTTMKEE